MNLTVPAQREKVTSISALQIARILHTMSYGLDQIAHALYGNYPSMTAVDIGTVLLDAGVCPDTRPADMTRALRGASFPEDLARQAATILCGLTVSVPANQLWHPTGLTITAGQATTICYLDGTWRAGVGNEFCDANGNGRSTEGQIYLPLPGAPEGALIGRIGNNREFLVGRSATVQPGCEGQLYLGINDDGDRPNRRDSPGSLTVRITTNP